MIDFASRWLALIERLKALRSSQDDRPVQPYASQPQDDDDRPSDPESTPMTSSIRTWEA